jgi:hypothetical protein
VQAQPIDKRIRVTRSCVGGAPGGIGVDQHDHADLLLRDLDVLPREARTQINTR